MTPLLLFFVVFIYKKKSTKQNWNEINPRASDGEKHYSRETYCCPVEGKRDIPRYVAVRSYISVPFLSLCPQSVLFQRVQCYDQSHLAATAGSSTPRHSWWFSTIHPLTAPAPCASEPPSVQRVITLPLWTAHRSASPNLSSRAKLLQQRVEYKMRTVSSDPISTSKTTRIAHAAL